MTQSPFTSELAATTLRVLGKWQGTRSDDFRDEIYAWLRDNAKDERKPTDTDEQFFYKTRKKALGPFKRRIWDVPDDAKQTLARAYERETEWHRRSPPV